MDLYDAAKAGNMDRVQLLLEQGADKDAKFGHRNETPLYGAASNGHLSIVQLLVEQGANMEKANRIDWTPLMIAAQYGHLNVVRYLLDQGANRDKASRGGWTSLHNAAMRCHLVIAKLLMAYGADLNARTSLGQLPIDIASTEEIKQAIRDEPRRRMDEAPGKRATEQDRHPNIATSASAQQEKNEAEEEDVEPINKQQRLDEEVAEEGKVAEEDEDSEPSDGEDD